MNFHTRPSDVADTTTDPEILRQLSHDEDWLVRYCVACNSNTSAETLEFLSHDEDYRVRWRVEIVQKKL